MSQEIIKTETGQVVHIYDGAPVPAKGFISNITPVQDFNGYTGPWAGGSNYNKFPTIANTETLNGVTATKNTDGSITLSGTATATTYFDVSTSFNSTLYAGYYFSGIPNPNPYGNGIRVRICASTSSRTALQDYYVNSSGVVTGGTLTDNGAGLCLCIRIASGTAITTPITLYPMLAATEGATYIPYANICPITGFNNCNIYVSPSLSPDAATVYEVNLYTTVGTVYGGYLNILTGVLTVNFISVTIDSSYTVARSGGRFYITTRFDDFIRSDEYKGNIISDTFPTVSSYTSVSNNGLGICGYPASLGYAGKNWIYFGNGDSSITSAAGMQAWLSDNPFNVVYKLHTPVIYNLTPLQIFIRKGENYIWSNTGNTTVSYIVYSEPDINNTTENNVIIANKNGVELRYLVFDTYDYEVGREENSFEIVIRREEYEYIPPEARIYIPDTELGGLFRRLTTDTEHGTISVGGITWRGMLQKKIIQPATGQDYAKDSGELNAIIKAKVEAAFPDLFYGVDTSTGVTVTNFQYERYCTLEAGLTKLLQSVGYKLDIQYSQADKAVIVQAVPIIDYTDSIEFSSDMRANYTMKQQGDGVNHLICLGKGVLKNRTVYHLYIDGDGNVSTTQYYTGVDEIAAIYDAGGSELPDLIENGTTEIKELANNDTFEIKVDPSIDVAIGDIVGGRDYLSKMTMSAPVWSKIIRYSAGITDIEYTLENDRMTVEENEAKNRSEEKTALEPIEVKKEQLTELNTDQLKEQLTDKEDSSEVLEYEHSNRL